MLLLPYQVDVPLNRWPISNVLIVVLTLYVHFSFVINVPNEETLIPYALGSGTPQSFVTHLFIHADYFHLVGNMVFLWTFGNAVCSKIGNLGYMVYYIALGMLSGLAHDSISGELAIGASGAVNGVVGMYFVFYPREKISCLFWFLIIVRTVHGSSASFILMFLFFDLYGAFTGAGGVAYWAHLGGFAAGFVTATVFLWFGLVDIDPSDESIYDLMD